MTESRKPGVASTMSRWLKVLAFGTAVGLMACSSPAEKAESYYKHGEAYLQKGDLVKASLEFKNALQLNRNMAKSWMGLADIAERQADWPRMYALLNKVVELDPKNLGAEVKLGRLLLAAGQYDKAMAASKAALALDKDDLSAQALRAAILFKLDDKKGAVEQADAVLAKDPNNVDALVVLASERLVDGDPAKAVDYLDRGLKVNDRNVALQLIKIQALDKMSDSASAEAVYKKLIEYYPNEPAFVHALAGVFSEQNRPAGRGAPAPAPACGSLLPATCSPPAITKRWKCSSPATAAWRPPLPTRSRHFLPIRKPAANWPAFLPWNGFFACRTFPPCS